MKMFADGDGVGCFTVIACLAISSALFAYGYWFA
jgi:hypothetical protein